MNRALPTSRRAFTLLELLVVIAIIGVLAAILFPVFAAVREQTRQSNTLSDLHSVYVGARLYNEDEGRFPPSLFGYALTGYSDASGTKYRPVTPDDVKNGTFQPIPLDESQGTYAVGTAGKGTSRGSLYGEQVKDYATFTNVENPIKDTRAITKAYYPRAVSKMLFNTNNLVPVTWQGTPSTNPPVSGGCSISGDTDLPADQNGVQYADATTGDGVPKYFYKMDSMDIGPMINPDTGRPETEDNGDIRYELHYSPNWTHQLYRAAAAGVTACDVYPGTTVPIKEQLKYKNPPTETTILTYVTQHVATSGSPNVMAVTLSGTARKLNYKQVYGFGDTDVVKSTALPFGYRNIGR